MWHTYYRLAEDRQRALRAERGHLDRAAQLRLTRPGGWRAGLNARACRVSGHRVAHPQSTGAPAIAPLPATGSGTD